MGNTAIEHVQWVLEQPLGIKGLMEAASKVDSTQLPPILKQPYSKFNKSLIDWHQCAKDIANIRSRIHEYEVKSQQASLLAEQYQSQLSDPAGLEHLGKLLAWTQTLQQEHNGNQTPILMDTWQQKRECLDAGKQLLQSHLKLIAQNILVERVHRLPLVIANLYSFGVNTTRNDTVEKIDELLTIHQNKLKERQTQLEAIDKLVVLLPLHENHQTLIDRINQLRKRTAAIAVERNLIDGELHKLQPIVEQHPLAYEQEKANFGTLAGANQYFSELVGTLLVKINLADKNLLAFQSIQKSLRQYLSLNQSKDQLTEEYNKSLASIGEYEIALHDLKLELQKKGVEDFSSYGLLEKTKEQLATIDPDFNYSHISILMVKQRVEQLRQTYAKDREALQTIVPDLNTLKNELLSIRVIREHHGITATNEELSQGYPWQSPHSLNLEETSLKLNAISKAIPDIESLCWYERDLQKTLEAIQQSDESSQSLTKELTDKQNLLSTLEQQVNEAQKSSKSAMEKAKKVLAKKTNTDTKAETGQHEQAKINVTSANLWQDFLAPLIKSQSTEMQSFITTCCDKERMNALSKTQQLQFEQLCHDIYIELKHADNKDNDVLLVYKATYSEANGLEKLLSLKPAIAIDDQNKLPSLTNKTVNQALETLQQYAAKEKGKMGDILLQIHHQLHYLAWQGEHNRIDASFIEQLQRQFTNDPRYQCLKLSKHYESIIDWLYGICQLIKQLLVKPANPIYHYGLFSKQPAYLEQATHISQAIAASA
jgi:hypothetical protein